LKEATILHGGILDYFGFYLLGGVTKFWGKKLLIFDGIFFGGRRPHRESSKFVLPVFGPHVRFLKKGWRFLNERTPIRLFGNTKGRVISKMVLYLAGEQLPNFYIGGG